MSNSGRSAHRRDADDGDATERHHAVVDVRGVSPERARHMANLHRFREITARSTTSGQPRQEQHDRKRQKSHSQHSVPPAAEHLPVSTFGTAPRAPHPPQQQQSSGRDGAAVRASEGGDDADAADEALKLLSRAPAFSIPTGPRFAAASSMGGCNDASGAAPQVVAGKREAAGAGGAPSPASYSPNHFVARPRSASARFTSGRAHETVVHRGVTLFRTTSRAADVAAVAERSVSPRQRFGRNAVAKEQQQQQRYGGGDDEDHAQTAAGGAKELLSGGGQHRPQVTPRAEKHVPAMTIPRSPRFGPSSLPSGDPMKRLPTTAKTAESADATGGAVPGPGAYDVEAAPPKKRPSSARIPKSRDREMGFTVRGGALLLSGGSGSQDDDSARKRGPGAYDSERAEAALRQRGGSKGVTIPKTGRDMFVGVNGATARSQSVDGGRSGGAATIRKHHAAGEDVADDDAAEGETTLLPAARQARARVLVPEDLNVNSISYKLAKSMRQRSSSSQPITRQVSSSTFGNAPKDISLMPNKGQLVLVSADAQHVCPVPGVGAYTINNGDIGRTLEARNKQWKNGAHSQQYPYHPTQPRIAKKSEAVPGPATYVSAVDRQGRALPVSREHTSKNAFLRASEKVRMARLRVDDAPVSVSIA